MVEQGKRLLKLESIRYLIAGGATTAVNLIVFFLLRRVCQINLNASNFIAISLAIIFAYVINKGFVFRSYGKNLTQEILSFIGARLLTMIIEMVSVGILVGVFQWNDMLSKFLTQFITIVLNYIFSKLFVFNKKAKEGWFQKNQLYMLAFVVPFLILIICCIIYEVEPFGDHSLVIIDGLHQYMPFFSVYQEKLQTADSLFYSWDAGLGLNFMALWAYYLSSPLNFIIVFFQQINLNGVISFLIITKIALSSMTMSIYLKNAKWNRNIKYKLSRPSWQILVFSMAYALSSYMIGYSWNVMWLETMIFLPLIVLGLERLIEENDGRIYCFMLFASLYCNFYMTFMTCIFLVFYYLLYDHKSFKSFIKKGFIFAGYSLLAGAMAAVVLLPTYNSLMMTSSAKMQFPKPELYGSFFDTLNSHGVATTVISNAQNDGGTNLYCGILTILLINLYIINRKIKLSVRIKQSLFMILLIVSFNLNWLNYIWHGFHDQYGIPNRFAFLYIFLAITMAYQVLFWIKSYRSYQILWSFGVIAGTLILSAIYSDKPLTWYGYLLTGALALIYTIFLLRYSGWRIKKVYFQYLVVSVMVIELGAHAIFGYSCVGQVSISKFFSTTEDMQEARKLMEKDTGLYRAELAKSKMLDEVTWHRLSGVNLFGSTAIGDVVYTMGRLGFYSAANEYLYRGSTPVTDAILGVKYLFLRSGESNYSNFSFYKSAENVDIYRNYQALPIGYMVSDKARDIQYRLSNPFDVQNNWISATMEDPVTIFETIETAGEPELNGCVSTYNSSGTVSYRLEQSQDDNIVFHILPEKEEALYVFITGNQIERILIKNGENIRCNERLNSQIIHVGNVTAGIPVTISLRMKSDQNTGQVSIKAAVFDEDAFLQYYNTMADEGLQITEHKSNSLTGNIEVQEEGVLFTSIPYDLGWTVWVDGQKVNKEQIVEVADAFLAFPLEEGEHRIEMEYVPSGYKAGIYMTGGSIVIFIICNLYHRRKKKRISLEKKVG